MFNKKLYNTPYHVIDLSKYSFLITGGAGFIGIKKRPETRLPSAMHIHTPNPDFKPSNTNALQEGQLVEHPKFGYGKVQKIETEGLNKKASIQFEHFGEKTLLLSFAKLRIID